eukprot:g21274.t1
MTRPAVSRYEQLLAEGLDPGATVAFLYKEERLEISMNLLLSGATFGWLLSAVDVDAATAATAPSLVFRIPEETPLTPQLAPAFWRLLHVLQQRVPLTEGFAQQLELCVSNFGWIFEVQARTSDTQVLLRAFDLGLGRRPLAPRRQVETLEVAEELPIANLRRRPRVRTCAVQLAGHVYGTHGFEAMEPILQRLRPAKQALLKSKFQEMDEDGAEEECQSVQRESDKDMSRLEELLAKAPSDADIEKWLSFKEGQWRQALDALALLCGNQCIQILPGTPPGHSTAENSCIYFAWGCDSNTRQHAGSFNPSQRLPRQCCIESLGVFKCLALGFASASRTAGAHSSSK